LSKSNKANNMKRVSEITVLIILFKILSALPVSAQGAPDAYSAISDQQCISAIHKVHSDMENRVGGGVGEVSYYDPSRQTTDSPYEKSNARKVSPVPSRQMQINFGLLSTMSRGRQASKAQEEKNSAIVSSPSLTKNYTEQILGACAEVGSVSFWLWEYGIGWSIDGKGELTQDRCVDAETWERRPLVWGEMLCT